MHLQYLGSSYLRISFFLSSSKKLSCNNFFTDQEFILQISSYFL